MIHRTCLLASTATFVALGLSSSAWAQTAQAPAPAAPSTQLETVVVTAEHRSTNVQKTPLAIIAVTAATLETQNVNSVSKIQNIVPGLKITEVGVQPSIFIRGIGSAVANTLNDPAASFNLDGVAVARPLSTNGLFFDLDRVEVLKGPQGTLYGRNATVGAINVISKDPAFDHQGSVGVTLGDYNLIQTEGMLNIPINDQLAFRAGFQTNKHNGYISNGTDDADDVGGRFKVLYKPNDKLKLVGEATIFHSGGKGIGDVPLKSPGKGDFLFPDNPWQVGVGPVLVNGGLQTPDDAHQDLRVSTVSANVSYDLGFTTVTLTPAHIDSSYSALTYNGGFTQKINSKDLQDSIEGRFASNTDLFGKLKWQVGGIYLKDDQNSTTDNKTSIPGHQITAIKPNLDSWAIFTQETWSFSPQFRLTGGLRYSSDHKTVSGSVTNVADATGLPTSTYPDIGDHTWTSLDYRAGVDYDLTPNALLYANVSTGYKSGGFFSGRPPNTYKPEHLTSYQIGSKNQFLDRRLQVNVEAWYWDYRDFQVSQFGFVNGVTPLASPANIGFLTVNAPKAENYGIEAQAAYRLTAYDRVNLNVQYDVARYVKFTSQAFAPTGTPAADYSGTTVPNAPLWSGNWSYSHTFDFDSKGRVVGTVSQQITSGQIIVLQLVPFGRRREGYTTTDVDMTYFSADGKWQVGVYGANLENAAVLLFAGNTPAGVWGHPRPPRNYGVKLKASF